MGWKLSPTVWDGAIPYSWKHSLLIAAQLEQYRAQNPQSEGIGFAINVHRSNAANKLRALKTETSP